MRKPPLPTLRRKPAPIAGLRAPDRRRSPTRKKRRSDAIKAALIGVAGVAIGAVVSGYVTYVNTQQTIGAQASLSTNEFVRCDST